MEEEEESLFSNMFAKLSLSKDYESDEEENDENERPETSTSAQTKPKAQPRPGKHKKSKKAKGKKSKSKGTATTTQATDTEFEEFPIESFRIIADDESGEVTDYLLAVYAWFKQSMQLRSYLQDLWWKVATDKVNSAVAGSLSEVAIAKVKQLQAEIISEFGLHHGNFDTLANTITRGNPEKACGNFRLALFQVPNDNSKPVRMVKSTYIDTKEGFFLHGYWDLLAFIIDWQATRSGKPTKKMMKELNKWDPYLDLRKVSKEERIQWRRQYTINWLYDLIGVYSAIAVQRKYRGMPIVYDKEDWSADGKYKEHRRLYGLNRFAGEVTALAMSKLDVGEIKKRILPHTVFELQLIVDSWTASRGWTQSLLNGHILKTPPPKFKSTRDVDMFLDKDNKLESIRGFVPSVDIFVQMIERDEFTAGNQGSTNELHQTLLPSLSEDFICWLGSSKLAYGLDNIPPTRFASTNPNGLWAYNPYLNGVGLAEALDITFQYGMFTWDSQPEPMLTIHLHNMLVKLGYLKREVGLWGSLADIYKHSFFADGKEPTSNFQKAFNTACSLSRSSIHRSRRHPNMDTATIESFLETQTPKFFKNKSLLVLLRRANWDPDAIPDADLPLPSMIAFRRLEKLRKVRDLTTGKMVLDPNNILLQKCRSLGVEPNELLEGSAKARKASENTIKLTPELTAQLDAQLGLGPEYTHAMDDGMESAGNFVEELKLVQLELMCDINSDYLTPYSAPNYISIMILMLTVWMKIEEALKKSDNPWVRKAYDGTLGDDPRLEKQKRMTFTVYMLSKAHEEDPGLCQLVADVFENTRCGFLDNVYWGDLTTFESDQETIKEDDGDEAMRGIGGCSIM